MMDLGRVVGVHPEDNSVDIVLVSNNARVPGVTVLTPMGSSIAGFTDLPEPAAGGSYWDNIQAREYETFAAVGFFAGRPMVIGFLFPQVSEVLFKRKNFRVDRHASDWYQTIDENANVEWCHPSGSFVRVAENPNHENLDGQDFDGKWKQKRNLDRQPWLSVMLRNAAHEEVMRLRVDPQGNVHLKHSLDLHVETGQHGTVNIAGNAVVTVGGNASVAVQGNCGVDVGGATAISSGGAMSISAPQLNIAAEVNIQGNVATQGSLTNNGTNVSSTHTHGGIQGGPGRTQPPG